MSVGWYRRDGSGPLTTQEFITEHIPFGAEATVERTVLPGPVTVSTVFLGLDHGYGETPLIFETMIFGGTRDEDCIRYSTEQQARDGHAQIVRECERCSNE